MNFAALSDALLLSAGYNSAVVTIGAALLGLASGAIGVFVFLRKQALISDAISHATLPGICIAFMLAATFLGSGRQFGLLLIGAAISGGLGIVVVQWITRETRLNEDAAIGTVLSTFFALGIVLLSVVQGMQTGGQAGLEDFLLGSAASMLASEALLIAFAALAVCLAIVALRKELTVLCFDPEYAESLGLPTERLDLAIVVLLLAVIVIGLSTVGLVLIIALSIIPAVAARFWTERVHRMVWISAAIGGIGAYFGAALSSTAPGLPTGGVIVLVLFAIFTASMVLSPVRGVLSAIVRNRHFQHVVHRRQGLLALARGEPVFEPLTLRLLRRAGLVDGANQLTASGRVAADRMVRDQTLWNRYRADYPEQAMVMDDWSLKPIEQVLPGDLVAELEFRVRRDDAGAVS